MWKPFGETRIRGQTGTQYIKLLGKFIPPMQDCKLVTPLELQKEMFYLHYLISVACEYAKTNEGLMDTFWSKIHDCKSISFARLLHLLLDSYIACFMKSRWEVIACSSKIAPTPAAHVMDMDFSSSSSKSCLKIDSSVLPYLLMKAGNCSWAWKREMDWKCWPAQCVNPQLNAMECSHISMNQPKFRLFCAGRF